MEETNLTQKRSVTQNHPGGLPLEAFAKGMYFRMEVGDWMVSGFSAAA